MGASGKGDEIGLGTEPCFLSGDQPIKDETNDQSSYDRSATGAAHTDLLELDTVEKTGVLVAALPLQPLVEHTVKESVAISKASIWLHDNVVTYSSR
jgi:hypothetical protein